MRRPCAATLCGDNSYGAMGQWGKSYGRDLALALGSPGGRAPAIGTLHAVSHHLDRHLDRKALEAALGQWAQAQCVRAHLPETMKTNALALDGEALCGSKA